MERKFDQKIEQLAANHTEELKRMTNNIKEELTSFRKERKAETVETMSAIQETIRKSLLEFSAQKVATPCREPLHGSGEEL